MTDALAMRSVHTGSEGREEGQGWERVQCPYCLVKGAIYESSSPCWQTSESPARWQGTEDAVCGVGGVTHDPGGPPDQARVIEVL